MSAYVYDSIACISIGRSGIGVAFMITTKNVFMIGHGVKSIACLLLLLLGGCATPNQRPMTFDECSVAKDVCVISGSVRMSSDGHGFIGELGLADGRCVNVSLPTSLSRKLMGQAPKPMSVRGAVLGFPFGEDLSHFEVNGRRIGFGRCSNFFVFVE